MVVAWKNQVVNPFALDGFVLMRKLNNATPVFFPLEN
jgi:hypothetical protein